MNIKLVSQKTGLSSSQIRYYEKQNIIPAVTRDSFGNRDFAQVEIEWLLFAKQMRQAGISIKALKHYVSLFYQGPDTINNRIELLKEEKLKLVDKANNLNQAIQQLELKIINYKTHLIKTEEKLK
ncbi:MerR family transcriptional regulator [Weissella paramesenteroides]